MPHASIGATSSFDRFGEAQRFTPDLAGFPTVGKGAIVLKNSAVEWKTKY
jgi:hypothetical protein